jgi:8-oxo-dGTP diphosphatase
MTTAVAPIDVAVGVVIRGDGSVLLGQRVPGKPYAGWWEFPGGKVEPGESVEQALARELHEELGLNVNVSLPWVVRDFVYPHATVRLHFRRVVDFHGDPASREGQAFVWRSPRSIEVAPLLPASVPVIGWLRVSTLCVRSNCASIGEMATCAAIERALRRGDRGPPAERRAAADPGSGTHASRRGATAGDMTRLVAASVGTPLVVLDEPELSGARFESLFYRVRALCAAQGASLLIGDSHPPSYAQAAGGTLVSTDRLDRLDARPDGKIAAARCRSGAHLARAARLGFDLAFAAAGNSPDLGGGAGLPVFRESDRCAQGLHGCLAAAWREGAHGLALPSTFWQDPAGGEPVGQEEK